MSLNLTVLILTKNESIHLSKYLPLVQKLTDKVIIIDSYSDDDTLNIARQAGVEIYQHKFIHQADQINWALEHCTISTPWIMRLDADEYPTPQLIAEINQKLNDVPKNITGIILKRRVYFMGKWIRFGGYYPIKLLRIWRKGIGKAENRWMDEHIVLAQGETIQFEHDFIDENLNNLMWWTEKHNQYSTREAVDMLFSEKELLMDFPVTHAHTNTQITQKRWVKENFYSRLPLFLRAFLYFNYRYIFRLGFLDGGRGLIWHFLQGFWYRFLVDAKIYQIYWLAKKNNKSIPQIIEEVFKIKIG